MGVIDSIVAGTGRATKTIQLKANLNEFTKKRENLITQLGASLYEETRMDLRFRATRQELYFSIEEIDAKIESVKNDIAALENESQTVALSNRSVICPSCGKTVKADSRFCTGCGKSLSMNAELTVYGYCWRCGSPFYDAEQSFCTLCGEPNSQRQVAAVEATVNND